MGKRLLMMVVLTALVSAEVCWGWAEHDLESTSLAEEEARLKGQEAREDEERFDAWYEWAYHRFIEEFGNKPEEAREAVLKMMNRAASGGSRYASQMAEHGMNSGRDGMDVSNPDEPEHGMNNAHDGRDISNPDEPGRVIRMSIDRDGDAREQGDEAMESGKEKAGSACDEALEKAGDAKEKMADAWQYGKDRASNAYDETRERMKDGAANAYDSARQRVNEASNFAKDKASDAQNRAADAYDDAKNMAEETYRSTRSSYEAAKEKASEAAGKLGEKMRSSPGGEL